ncbi:MAG: hypothetical protein ACP5I4_10985 [Oceanipulchritudo sp.]
MKAMTDPHLLTRFPRFSILVPALLGMLAPSIGAHAQAPQGDYGDAPDGGPSYYDLLFETSSETGNFPTLYNTTNGRINPNGIHHLDTTQEWFGPMDQPPSRETDANDTSTDEDGWQNLINSDMKDNGLPEIPFLISLTQMPPVATLSFFVSVPAGAPDVDRVFNLLIDWDQDGKWRNMGAYVPGAVDEWAVRNQVVRVAPGTTQLIQSQQFLWGWHALLDPQCFWMRMTISQVPVPDPLPDGWDGSGSFPTGETEDYLIHPDYVRDVEGGPWDPDDPGTKRPHRPLNRQQPGGGGGAGPAGVGPGAGAPAGKKAARPALKPSVVISPAFQTVPHATSALAHVVKQPATNPPADPVLSAWFVDNGWLNGAMNPGSPSLSPTNGTYYPFGAPLSSATWSTPIGGPAGTKASIIVASALDPRTPPTEDWNLSVDYSFPGAISGTAFGTVRVRHSQAYAPGSPIESGIPGVYLGGMRTILDSNIDEPDKSFAYNDLENSLNLFLVGNYIESYTGLDNLQDKLNNGLPGITTGEEVRLQEMINFLNGELDDISGIFFINPCPIPVIEWPADGAHVSGSIELQVTHLYEFVGIPGMITEIRDPVNGTWSPVAEPAVNLTPGSTPGEWRQPIDTTLYPDGLYDFRVTLTDSDFLDDYSGRAVVALRIDNSSPAVPVISSPLSGAVVGGAFLVNVASPPAGAYVAAAELSADGGATWIEADTDYDALDGWSFEVDLDQLPGGLYQLRVTCMDYAENTSSSAPVDFTVLPSYPGWKSEFSILDDEGDEDLDTIRNIFEYYAGLDPLVPDAVALLDYGINASGVLQFKRAEYVSGVTATVEASADVGEVDPWTPVEVDPPRQEVSGNIEVTLPAGDRQFGRVRLDPR